MKITSDMLFYIKPSCDTSSVIIEYINSKTYKSLRHIMTLECDTTYDILREKRLI